MQSDPDLIRRVIASPGDTWRILVSSDFEHAQRIALRVCDDDALGEHARQRLALSTRPAEVMVYDAPVRIDDPCLARTLDVPGRLTIAIALESPGDV